MRKVCHTLVAACVCLCWAWVGSAEGQTVAQQAAPPQKPAAEPQAPQKLPPPGSPPLLRYVQLDFPTQGGVSTVDPETYLYHVRCAEQVSRPSDGVWNRYDEQMVLDDFRRLWNTKFLDNLWVEVRDVPYENGVMGKHVIFNLEERQRVKIVDYVGSKKLEQTKIDEKLKEENALIRLDSFIDPSLVKKVRGIVLSLLGEKGYQYATVTPEIKELPGGPKLVQLTFRIDEGPRVKIKDVQFVGNRAIASSALKRQMKNNKAPGMFSLFLGKGTYQETKFEEDADRIASYYQDHGYVRAQIGDPELKIIEDSNDRRTRWIQLRIPVFEGPRYRVGTVDYSGNTVVRTEALRAIWANLKPGSYYSAKAIRKGLEKARDLYGSIGYFQFVATPDLRPRDAVRPEASAQPPSADAAADPAAPVAAGAEAAKPAPAAQEVPAPAKKPAAPAPRQPPAGGANSTS